MMMQPAMYSGGYGAPPSLFHPLLFVFYLLLVGFGLYLLISVYLAVKKESKSVTTAPPVPKEDDALRIVRERYAKGELTKEQFEKMKKDLEA